MKLTEAQHIIREVSGRQYSWMKVWGLSWIREAIHTIETRKSATPQDHELADSVKNKLQRKW